MDWLLAAFLLFAMIVIAGVLEFEEDLPLGLQVAHFSVAVAALVQFTILGMPK